MSQPVKLSDALVLDARLAGEVTERSIAGQVEFWARLGRSVETLLKGEQVLMLSRNAAVRPLSSCLSSVDSPEGRKRTSTWLLSQPFPHYESHATKPGLLVRTDEDGRQTIGRFVKREFRPVRESTRVKVAG
jgi:ParD-like antitoxin of type II bacterial toxin-antitoxin system